MYSFPFLPFRFWKTASIGIIILILCLIPSSEIAKLNVKIANIDLVVHFIMFSTFSAALYLEITKNGKMKTGKVPFWMMAFIISISLGIFTELLQYFLTPLHRTGSYVDLSFDLVGSLIGTGLAWLITRKSVPGT